MHNNYRCGRYNATMPTAKKRSNYRPPGRPQSEDIGTDDPERGAVVPITDQQRHAARDSLNRASTSGSARYVAGAEALDRLDELMAERERLERETRFTVDQARRCRVTWSEIGEALGVSQQAASKRFGSGAA
jgi:hypothetical protein